MLGCERGSVQHRRHWGLYLLRPCHLPPPAPPSDSPFLPQTSREMVARSAATLITHPFHGRCPPHPHHSWCVGPVMDVCHSCHSGVSLCPPRPPHCLSLPAVITLRCMVQFIGRETKYRYG